MMWCISCNSLIPDIGVISKVSAELTCYIQKEKGANKILDYKNLLEFL